MAPTSVSPSTQLRGVEWLLQPSDPGGIFSGSGGLAAPAGFPLWASGLVLLCAALAAGSAVALRKGR